jgi:glycerol-3-phosphate acyltransferase PlsY
MNVIFQYKDMIVAILMAYVLGSVSFAILVSKAFHLPDPRSYGSRNPGATNVARVNKVAAILTFLGDTGKGALAVLLAHWFWGNPSDIFALLAVVIGHNYNCFLGFRGGKGVATAIGGLLVLVPLAATILLGIWLVVFLCFRISALAAVVAAISAPFVLYWLDVPNQGVYAICALALLLIYRHRGNLQRLVQGRENRFR